MQSQFRGTGVALVTPFQKNEQVDYKALERLIDHVITNHVDFLVALGTTAETPTLSNEEKRDILAFVVEKCAGRMPVVCGIGGNNTTELLKQMKSFDLQNVDGILSVTPYYNKPSQDGLYKHFKAVADNTDKPVILYNVPGRTGCNMLPATVLKLANDFENIIGIKEASGNMVQCMEILQHKPDDFIVLSGDDNLAMAHVAIGMDGVISVAANCFTREFTELINLSIVGKLDKARKVHYKLLTGIDLLFAEGNPAGVKCVLAEMGICENVLRMPMVPASSALKQKIKAFLNS
ncbi:MAG: 4-hydroxy-tetrahydrodipicolinate synthase [Bacteroidetes bacterium 46-16]|nr:MAG: 4-hydroxy-tetrahydrodipicolinate synthase [Bacteroidetes bacterium 46-16]